MNMIIHPTHAHAMPVTHVAPGKTGKPRKVKAQKDITREDLAQLCIAKGLKVLTKHTKAELRQMYVTGIQVKPAAQARDNAARKAKRAAAKLG